MSGCMCMRVKQVEFEVMGWRDTIHTRDPGLSGIQEILGFGD